MKKSKQLKTEVQYALVLGLIHLFRALPRRTGIFVSQSLGTAFYMFSAKHRRNTIRHLTIAFGNEKTKQEIRRIARETFRHFAAAAVDAMRIPIFLAEGMDRYVKADHLEYLEAAAKQNRGVIILTGHVGNWELLGAWLAWKKFPLQVIGAPLSNTKLNRLLINTREVSGYMPIERGKKLIAIKALQEGRLLGILMDQDTRVKGVFVDFFGKKANTPAGPIVLARRLGVPVVPVFIHMEQDLTYHVEFINPLVLSDTGDPEKDVIMDIENCNRIYESMIRRHPEQWVWMHRRWKRQPVAGN